MNFGQRSPVNADWIHISQPLALVPIAVRYVSMPASIAPVHSEQLLSSQVMAGSACLVTSVINGGSTPHPFSLGLIPPPGIDPSNPS